MFVERAQLLKLLSKSGTKCTIVRKIFFYLTTFQNDFAEPDGKLEKNLTVEVTTLTANADNAVQRPTLGQPRYFFTPRLKDPRS